GLHVALDHHVGAVAGHAQLHPVEAPGAVLEHRAQGAGLIDGQAFPREVRNLDDHVSRFLLSVCQKKDFAVNRASISTDLRQVKAFGRSFDRPRALCYAPLRNPQNPHVPGRSRMSNVFKTGLLLAVLTAMLVVIGGAIGGQQGMVIAFVFALVMNFFSYWFSDKMVLAMYGAQPIEESQAPALYAVVRRLATRAQIPMPRVYLIASDTPNAFATGRNPEHAAVAVTEGIMRILDQDELEGVLAHELSHVKNRDVLISTIAATLAGAITYLAHMA